MDPASECTRTVAFIAGEVRANCPAALGLILTGSSARGEATFVRNGGEARWLSDIEFLVVMPEGTGLAGQGTALDALASGIGEKLRAQGVRVAVELTPTLKSVLARFGCHLFGYELRVHGKQIFGAEDYIAAMPGCGAEQIPRVDAWTLLSNRMLELLYLRHQRETLDALEQFYILCKQHLDMVTSMSLLAGRYADRYESRAAAAEALADWAVSRMPNFPAERMLAGAKLAAEFKLRPNQRRFEWLWSGENDLQAGLAANGWSWFHDELGGLEAALWKWELETLTGVRIEGTADLLHAIAKVHDWKYRARAWGKLALRPALRRNGSFFSRAARLVAAGTPRGLVYLCANMLMGMPGAPDAAALATIRKHLPVLYEAPAETWQDLADQCILNWLRYLRRSHL